MTTYLLTLFPKARTVLRSRRSGPMCRGAIMKVIQLGTGVVLWEGKTLSRANLSRANLYGADLSDADLSRANLSGADLSRADLSGANLIVGGQRSDGYRFLLIRELDGTLKVSAGCRYFTLFEARKHWKITRPNSRLGSESFELMRSLQEMATSAGWSIPI